MTAHPTRVRMEVPALMVLLPLRVAVLLAMMAQTALIVSVKLYSTTHLETICFLCENGIS